MAMRSCTLDVLQGFFHAGTNVLPEPLQAAAYVIQLVATYCDPVTAQCFPAFFLATSAGRSGQSEPSARRL